MLTTNSTPATVLPQADAALAEILSKVHQTCNDYISWRSALPHDDFLSSRWNDIDAIECDLVKFKCRIADLISAKMLDDLEQ